MKLPIALLMVSLTASAAYPQQRKFDFDSEDRKNLQGIWVHMTIEIRGKKHNVDEDKRNIWDFASGHLQDVSPEGKAGEVDHYTYRITSPNAEKRIELINPSADGIRKAISTKCLYQLQGDTLRLSVSFDDEWPTDFISRKTSRPIWGFERRKTEYDQLMSKGNAALAKKDYEEATKNYTQAILKAPELSKGESSLVKTHLGEVAANKRLMRIGNEVKAYDQVIKLGGDTSLMLAAYGDKPSLSRVYYEMAYAYQQKNEMKEAVDYYKSAIKASNKNVAAIDAMIAIMQERGDKNGIAQYQKMKREATSPFPTVPRSEKKDP